jgi:hypothetical protein
LARNASTRPQASPNQGRLIDADSTAWLAAAPLACPR